ncbi:MAG: hypothetical protein U9N81_00040 [Bacillota bacterium]|nr:hypothetical protein [Bacillota bacterium]
MKHQQIVISILFCLLFIFVLPLTASADIGPKDSLTIYVENPPSEQYYLDLLTQSSSTYENFNKDGERETLNDQMVDLLYAYQNEGWMPALTEGTGVPMWGDLVGEPAGDKMVHHLGYVGLPDTYRIVIVTESGNVAVSDTYTRQALQSSITFDYETGQAVVPNIWISYLIQFITTCIPTLLIEGMILLLFGFKFKENFKIFLLVNIFTQIFLTATLGAALIKGGTLSAYFTQFPVEIIILVTEAMIYYKFLIGKSPKRRFVYGIAANLASWAIGFFLLSYQYKLLVSFM